MLDRSGERRRANRPLAGKGRPCRKARSRCACAIALSPGCQDGAVRIADGDRGLPPGPAIFLVVYLGPVGSRATDLGRRKGGGANRHWIGREAGRKSVADVAAKAVRGAKQAGQNCQHAARWMKEIAIAISSSRGSKPTPCARARERRRAVRCRRDLVVPRASRKGPLSKRSDVPARRRDRQISDPKASFARADIPSTMPLFQAIF